MFPDMSVEENLLMGTIPIGTAHADEDMQRMFDLFPGSRNGATSGP